MNTEKDTLRKNIKELRNNMELKEQQTWDHLIYEQCLKEITESHPSSVFLYVSTPTEVDTHKLISTLLTKGITIIVPKMCSMVNDNLPTLSLHIISKMEDLKPSSYGVLEPKSTTEQVDPRSIDLAFIPGLAFDRNFNRIGYGKGYFDVFMKQLSCPKIALAYDFQILQNVPVAPHDVAVTKIITPTQVISL